MFGYLPQSDMETGALRTQEEMRRAIREFQTMARLPVTGQFDAATVEKMHMPRCGMADVNKGPSGYAIGPSKWDRKTLSFR